MSKQLEQDEIDRLLGSGFGDADPGQARSAIAEQEKKQQPKLVYTYNFKRPRLFSQDQMRILHQVHETFARDLSVYLSAQLRTIVDIELSALDQVLYNEFVIASAPPSALFVVDAMGTQHQSVFELDPRFVIFTIEKLFGGPGTFLKKPRETSQIEQRIMGKVMTRAFEELEIAWRQVAELKFRESSFESNAEFVQIIPGSEAAIVVTFEVTVQEQRSFINICYPYLLMESTLGRSGTKKWTTMTTIEMSDEEREQYEHSLKALDVDMRAELGQASLNLTDLMNLEEGDVILLNQRKDMPINIYVGDQPKFQAAPGRAGNYRALRVMRVLNTDTPQKEDE